jgi:hypothetical protein
LRSVRAAAEREKVALIYDAGKNGIPLEEVLGKLKLAYQYFDRPRAEASRMPGKVSKEEMRESVRLIQQRLEGKKDLAKLKGMDGCEWTKPNEWRRYYDKRCNNLKIQ